MISIRPSRSSRKSTRRAECWARGLRELCALGMFFIVFFGASRLPRTFAQSQPGPDAKATSETDAADGEEAERPEDPPLPKLSEMELPSPKELLEGDARDWIVLKDQRVIVASPVHPRPDTLAKMDAKIEASDVGPTLRDPVARRKQQKQREELEYLVVQLPDDPLLYRLHREHIEQVILFEDQMLRQANRLIDEGRLREAFELLFVVARRAEEWPGLAEAQQKLLDEQARKHAAEGHLEQALVDWEELHSRRSDYPGLSRRVGEVVDELMTAAVAESDFRRARHFLERLTSLDKQHPIALEWTDELTGRARTLLDSAEQAYSADRYDVAATEVARAAEVWPRLAKLRPAFVRMRRRFQILNVGTVTSPDEDANGTHDHLLAGAAEHRRERLVQSRLFEIAEVDRMARFRSEHVELWEPTDLGRRVELLLKQESPAENSESAVDAADVARALLSRLDERSPEFDERLAAYVDSVAVSDAYRLDIHFGRVPLRPEPLLNVPLGDGAGKKQASGTFRVRERTADSIAYRRSVPQPNDARQYYVAEIVEHRYESPAKAVQALLRGEVTMLPRVQPWDVAELRDDKRFVMRRVSVPTTHVVQFNPPSPVAKDRELRRALAYAIDRRRILDETILRLDDSVSDKEAESMGRVVTGPFLTRSFAYDRSVQPRTKNPTLAATLAFSARKRMGGKIPKMRMICGADPLSRSAAQKLIEEWKRIQVDVELVAADAAIGNGEWDLVYRTVKLTEPLTDLWPFLILNRKAEVAGLTALPAWLRQEVVDLEYVADWKNAEDKLRRIHRHLAAEAQLLPLWEVEEYQVLRQTVTATPVAASRNPRPVDTYDGIEHWIVEPWYPSDQP